MIKNRAFPTSFVITKNLGTGAENVKPQRSAGMKGSADGLTGQADWKTLARGGGNPSERGQ